MNHFRLALNLATRVVGMFDGAAAHAIEQRFSTPGGEQLQTLRTSGKKWDAWL